MDNKSKRVVIKKPKIPTSQHEQDDLLFKNVNAIIYSNKTFEEVEFFCVDDPNSIWIQNASGFAYQLLDALPISVFVKDKNSRYTYLNAKARSMMRFNEKLIIGKKDSEVLTDKKNMATYLSEDKNVMETKKKRWISEPWITERGDYIIHQTWRYPILDFNRLDRAIGVVSIAEDITYKQKASIGREIVSMISHDWITEMLRSLYLAHSNDVVIRNNSEIFNFILEYLDNLSFYYAGEFDNNKFIKGLKQDCNLMQEVFKPMIHFFKFFGQGDPYYVLPSVKMNPLKFILTCNSALLKIMIYQQLRNHYEHGKDKTKLIIEVVKSEKYVLITFKSKGSPLSENNIKILNQPYYVESEDEADEARLHLGLYLCNRVAILHKGGFDKYYYDQSIKSNCFRYKIKEINK